MSAARLLDAQILGILREYRPLHPLASEDCAHKVGETARKYGIWIGLVRVALERLALKITQGRARPDLPLARAYVKRQWPIAHPDVELPPRPEEPEFSAEELAELGPVEAEAGDPTPEELAAMRAGLSGALALVGEAEQLEQTAAEIEPTGATTSPELKGSAVFHLALDSLRRRSPMTFDQWFSGVQFDGLADGVLYLRARNDFVAGWIERNFLERLTAELGQLVGCRTKVVWAIESELERPLALGLPPSPKPRRR